MLPLVLIPFLERCPTTWNNPERSWLFWHSAIVDAFSGMFGIRLFQQFVADGLEGSQDGLNSGAVDIGSRNSNHDSRNSNGG